MKKIEKRKLIAIIISIVIGIVFTLLLNFNSLGYKITFENPQPTQKDYDIFKSYALDVAKGEEIHENSDVKVEKKIEKDVLKIKIEIPHMYGVDANFPISAVKDLEIENGTIKHEAVINYEDATYSEYKLMDTKAKFIFRDLLICFAFATFVYIIFYWLPKEWKRDFCKENKIKNYWPNTPNFALGVFLC